MASAKPYEPFDHTADVGVTVYGDTLEELFEHGAVALADTLVGIDRVRPQTEHSIEAAGDDLEELMVSWLGELLYRFEAERWVYSRFRVTELALPKLVCTAWGEPFDPARHPVAAGIKAVTYHELRVEQVQGRWQTRVVFDV